MEVFRRFLGILIKTDPYRFSINKINIEILNNMFLLERNYMSTVLFEDLNLNPQILRAIKEMGFEEATPIQAQSIPAVMSGRDVIGQAQTGTGKTASFGIPLLHKVDPKLKKTQALILCPTRELAIQVSNELHNLAKYMHGIKILPIYGGQEIGKQIRSLKGGVQIIVVLRAV